MSRKFNGYAKWILIALAIGTIAYNTVVTHVIARNDIKHLRQDVNKLEVAVSGIQTYLMGHKQ